MPRIDRGGSPKAQGMKEEREKKKEREEETTKRSRAKSGMSIESVSETFNAANCMPSVILYIVSFYICMNIIYILCIYAYV
jgi:hypothetical protein